MTRHSDDASDHTREPGVVPGPSRRLFALALSALVSACATTKTDPEHEQYIEQIANATQRYTACTQGHVAQYSQSKTATNDKVARAAMKQCAVYAANVCHAQVELDALASGNDNMSPEEEMAAEAACLQVLTESRRAELLAGLAVKRPQGTSQDVSAPQGD